MGIALYIISTSVSRPFWHTALLLYNMRDPLAHISTLGLKNLSQAYVLRKEPFGVLDMKLTSL